MRTVSCAPGEIYFLTDGQDLTLREFMGRMPATLGPTLPQRSVPFAVADALARLAETAWRTLPLKGEPPLTPTAVHLIGREVTVNDAKSRRKLGYVGHTTREEGPAEMQA